MYRTISFTVLAFLLVACGGSAEPETVTPDMASMSHQERVEYHIGEGDHEAAFRYISESVTAEPERSELLLVTHMTFAWEMTHGEIADQRTRMPAALQHLRRALELDPGNAQAMEQIQLIEGIYRSLNRPIPEGVAEDRVML